MLKTLHLVEINEGRSGFTGDRDRAKLRKLSKNLRNQGSSELEIQNHIRGWLKKRGKLHYHGTPYEFEGLPKSNAEQRGEEGEDFSDNAVHVGTLKAAQERLRNRDMSVESDAGKPISPRIIPLTVNVGKNSHPLGSTSAPFRDGTASNFGKNVTTRDPETGESRATRLPLSHLTPRDSSNRKGYKEVTPRDDQHTVVYRNGVEDKGANSYSTNKPKRTLRTLHDLANQQESNSYTPVTNEYVQNLLEGLSGQLKGNLQPVQHQGQDPTNTRETAVKAMKKQIDDAKKSGKDVIYRVEGRDEEHQAGDPETEDRIRAYAKKQDVNYEEGSLEGETKAGGKKIQKIAKSYDPKKGDYRAFPEDDPTGKTKPNEISRGVKAWNAGRRIEMRKIIQKDLDSGKVVIGTLGAGHFNQPK